MAELQEAVCAFREKSVKVEVIITRVTEEEQY